MKANRDARAVYLGSLKTEMTVLGPLPILPQRHGLAETDETVAGPSGQGAIESVVINQLFSTDELRISAFCFCRFDAVIKSGNSVNPA